MGRGKNRNKGAQAQVPGAAPGPSGAVGACGHEGGAQSSAPDPSLAVLALHPQGHAVAVALGSCVRVFDCRCALLLIKVIGS